MNNHTTSITTNKKHHYRELLAIGIPIIIGQLGTIILGFADTLMIGHSSRKVSILLANRWHHGSA